MITDPAQITLSTDYFLRDLDPERPCSEVWPPNTLKDWMHDSSGSSASSGSSSSVYAVLATGGGKSGGSDGAANKGDGDGDLSDKA